VVMRGCDEYRREGPMICLFHLLDLTYVNECDSKN
jgi:hypothetical protein